MRSKPDSSPQRRDLARRALSRMAWIWIAVLLAVVPTLPGCGGCNKAPKDPAAEKEAEEKRKEEEKNRRKPDFEAGRMLTQPNAISALEASVKPGHWSSATFELVSNHYDFQGVLRTDPYDLDGLPYRLGASRTVTLPKGQKRVLEMTFFVPPGKKGTSVGMRLDSKDGARDLLTATFPALRMKAHQFYFFVFAEDADRYAFLRDEAMDSINPADGDWGDSTKDAKKAYYRVMAPVIKKRTPLPSNPLVWTSMAYMLWDGKDPALLSPEQQACLVDWLHWGGQLIVSGPGTFEKLQGSFLEKYLPASGGGKLDITAEDLKPFNTLFTQNRLPLSPVNAWSGEKLLIDPDTSGVNVVLESPQGEPLVVERRVGRGHIVVTAFRLAQRELNQWVGFDAFFNSCLLRRGPRVFSISEANGLQVSWAGAPAPSDGRTAEIDPSLRMHPGTRLDPRRVSDVRFFSRDATFPGYHRDWHVYLNQSSLGRVNPDQNEAREDDPRSVAERFRELLIGGGDEDEAAISGGVAGWSHFNPPAEFARDALRKAAGIRIPKAEFVLWTLATYLIVLVPVNWAVFRMLGRVEWAWFAAPVITMLFAAGVVRLADLDVGFARARTEIGIVELQGGFKRAHVTRYTALYTSLGTNYEFRFDDPSALVQPFPPFSRNTKEEVELLRGQSRATVNYRRHPRAADEGGGTSITLEGFTVSSNSLGMVHSEHMHDLSGTVRLSGSSATGLKVDNDTDYSLKTAFVVRPALAPQRNDKDENIVDPLEVAWIGNLPAGERATLSFAPKSREELWSAVDEDVHDAPINKISSLVRLACERLEPGELRLVSWTDDELEGMSIEPKASQTRRATLVVTHLKYGPRPAPLSDLSSRTEQEAKIKRGEGPDVIKQ